MQFMFRSHPRFPGLFVHTPADNLVHTQSKFVHKMLVHIRSHSKLIPSNVAVVVIMWKYIKFPKIRN